MKDRYMNRAMCRGEICSQTCKTITTLRGVAPNFWQGSRTIYTVTRIKISLVDAVEYCLNIENFVRSLMFFGHCQFGHMLANGRVFRAESRYSSNDERGLHCHTGRGGVSGFNGNTTGTETKTENWERSSEIK